MNLVDYYEGELASDIRALSEASGGDFSVVAFVHPTTAVPGRDMQRLFHAMPVERQVAFLMGFHFCALLDQAVHDSIRERHARFDDVARYPKLRGILASYWTNMHPALLLGVASGRVDEGAIEATTEEFERLSAHVVTEYGRFLVEDFADLADVPRGDQVKDRLLAPVFSSLSSAYAILFLPAASSTKFPFHVGSEAPRAEVFQAWCGIVRADIHRVGGAAGVWDR
jgi:hypothetical protein